jgi:hypothetical protein
MALGQIWVLAMAAGAAPMAAAPPPPPPALTHCAPGEIALFSSQMGLSVWNDARTRKKLKGDKILSLCVDRMPAPKKLAVRFGKPGVVELEAASPATKFRLTQQDVGGGESWTALSFDAAGASWSFVQPEGGDARDAFLIVAKNAVFIARSEAISEGAHWALFPKKFGKKKTRDVPAMLADLPAIIAPRSGGPLDAAQVHAVRYVANLALPK